MADFVAHKMDFSVCRDQMEELRTLLQSSSDLPERQLNHFFRARAHLSALVGHYHRAILRFDRLAWEYSLFGDFQCDIVVGDSVTQACTFVELEDAGPKSLFVKRGKKATREWSSRFEHGYSQIVDWFYKMQSMINTPDMEDRFGKRSIDYMGILVVGRDHHMDAGERMRLEWRREHIVVNSRKVVCVTYDQLLDNLAFQLNSYLVPHQASGDSSPK